MSNKFTLESIVEEIEKKYAPMTLTVNGQDYVLVSLLRTSRKVRDSVQEKLKSMGGEPDEKGEMKVDSTAMDEDKMIESFQFIISSVTKDGRGQSLVRALPNDMVVLMEIFKKWQEATQPGEASDSPN